jgi:serine protease Do
VDTNTALHNAIGLMRVGSEVTLGLLRDGKALTVKAVIGKESDEEAGGGEADLHGLSVANLDKNSPMFGQVQGVLITGVDQDSDAAQAGLRSGDVIVAVSQQPVKSVVEFRKAADAASKANQQLFLTVRRGDQMFYAALGG